MSDGQQETCVAPEVEAVPDVEAGKDAGKVAAAAIPEPVKPAQSETAELSAVVVVPASLAMGFLFGFFFEKSHVYEPRSIRMQFVFEQWTMMKMFMGAVAASCLIFSFLSIIKPTVFARVRENFPPPKRGWFTGGLLGGALLGAGMVLAGACPGMVLPQVGTALPNSLLTLAGGLLGALAFGLAEPVLKPNVLEKGPVCDTGAPHVYADKFLNVRYAVLALPFGLGCGAFAVLLELLVDYRAELGVMVDQEASNPFALYAWPPSLCGFLLGCLQLPCSFIMSDSMGSATAYQCVMSQWLALAPSAASKWAYMEKHRKGAKNWWQVCYCLSAIVGALTSAALTGNLPTSAQGVDVASALLGGFLMIFGSRMAGGCTSGHGISGMPLLHGLSILAVCGMFGFGIVLGFVMKFSNVLQL